MRCVRVWFNKTGDIRFISHLDLMRVMTRAIRRTKIPLWYTEGFNPHAYITFSLPLSLGMESICESMDIRIEGEISDNEIFSRLKGSMPAGIDIVNVCEPVHDAKKIMYGEFDIYFETENSKKLKAFVEEIFSKDELIVQKLSKQGRHKVMKDINLMEFVKSQSITIFEDKVKLNIILPAGSVKNINPQLFTAEIQKLYDGDVSCLIIRKKLMLENMKAFR